MVNGGDRAAIPSKRFDVWQRLYDRYTLEPGSIEGISPPALSTLIAPTTDADRLLSIPDAKLLTVATVAQATLTLATVPQGERWTVRFFRVALDTGTWTHNRIDVRSPGNVGIPISAYAQSSTSHLFEPNTPVLLDELWDIRLNIDTFTTGGDAQLKILVDVEDAF